MSTPDISREQQINDEWLEAWTEANLRHLYEACADFIPWTDAGSGSEKEGENPWVTYPEEDPAPTAWQEPPSSSEQSAA